MSSRAETALLGVYEISKLLASPNRLEAELAGVLALLSSFMDMNNGLIALLTPDGAPDVVVGSDWNEGAALQYFERLPERVLGQIVVTKMPYLSPDVRSDPVFANADLGEWAPSNGDSYCLIGVPIKEGDRVAGVMTVTRSTGVGHHPRLDEDVRFLVMIANLIGQTCRFHRAVARDRERLLSDQRRLEKQVERQGGDVAHRERPGGLKGIIGESEALNKVVEKIHIVAKSNSTVMFRGESGTGKELFATAIHELSPRNRKPFIKVNCAAIPESVLESELFGHEKGAFTGAVNQRKGRFELADGGTLFLDEIGEISASFQAKLLRVLQEGEFERVGGSSTLKVDVRLICATNRNLEAAVESGEFRADLYYRINVVPILLPPLRARVGDVHLLADEFVRRFNLDHGVELSLSQKAHMVLATCYFPGNIRELENCIRRTATLAKSNIINDMDFACRNDVCLSSILWKGAPPTPPSLTPERSTALAVVSPRPDAGPKAAAEPAPSSPEPQRPAAAFICPDPSACPIPGADFRSERERLVEAMETAGWVQAKAARILGLTPRQVGYALRKHDVNIKRF
ncbi:MAG: nif-specific transcriptional activator NifA [Pseudomonadota bacterium]|jgi:Nif-specific regulatory protein